jgi:circadian clock protein KaiC
MNWASFRNRKSARQPWAQRSTCWEELAGAGGKQLPALQVEEVESERGHVAGIPNEAVVRSELRRLFDWLKDRQLSTVITAERGEGSLTRHGIEEYVSDCVILLDHRIVDDLSTRRLRVVKYRGTSHGTNEYPFLIDDQGITVVPITSTRLAHAATDETVSSGVSELDCMLGRGGYFRGSSIMLSGGPGTGKTTIGASFADRTNMQPRRTMLVLRLRGKPEPARAQHALGGHRFAALDRPGIAARPIIAAQPRRP